ncbi:MAG: aminotransferase class I/II-fold pyridoxal phosphate-dependent enzyme [Chloroflexi bacterium]|uniref:Aminotransferase n=1 Tax=Candidatus Chlorohelix allophototropha TaxID=3003348 RepID=A0A8T7LZ82_9CHLR|nr:aminotransferase class I/II-fold pyridoxal phosphate-dependent enzyme [Chloroflexota bacterium]WJW66578.1 aminotransferase class I/II-fold pyridoxal phosphate-dependent enzyme [Chloroflexota bacterium L227-S17]
MAVRISQKAGMFSESVIREMTRIFLARGDKPGVNLAQGFPDFPAPSAMKEAASRAIHADINQYAITWGSKSLRHAIAAKVAKFSGFHPDPEREITVACGATEAMMAAMLAVVDPGDEVIVFEPFYENYGPDAILSGAQPRFVTLHEPDWHFDEDELTAAFNNKTRAIIINTPNNPTGKVFNRAELEFIGALCQKWNVVAITDEIYEHMVYEGEHVSLATLPGMYDHTITISGLSKTYSATGWRIGWLIAPPHISSAIRKVHDFLTVGAAAPLQEGAATALAFPDSYYHDLQNMYLEKRNKMVGILEKAGFEVYKPNGAYYIMTDISRFGFPDDMTFARYLVDEIGVGSVPGSSFYRHPEFGKSKVRFTFCKKPETLDLAAELLSKLQPR